LFCFIKYSWRGSELGRSGAISWSNVCSYFHFSL
jgi:hypothetical protein